MPRYFKVLNEDGTACHSGHGQWPLPNNGRPGKQLSVKGKLSPCEHGLHLCREQDLVLWLGPAIYAAQYQGKRIDCDDKIVVRRARLLQRLGTWDDRSARLFACDCADRALALLKKPDPRSVEAVAVARRFAVGDATREQLDAARDAAWAAAGDAAGAAARHAAWYAVWAAAWAAGAAAWDAARDAAWAAAWAAGAAAGDAAGDAAGAAARAAAWAAARAAQEEQFLKIVS